MKTHTKSRKIILFFLAVSFILPACNKNTPIWEARVLEYGSNKPIANATVYLVEKGGEVILGPVSSAVVDSTTTGPDGKFRFKLLHESAAHYIRGKADLYYDAEIYRGGNTSNNTKKDLILDPHAWLRIHVKNVNPVDENDYISLGINTHNCVKGFWGNTIDTIFICDNFKGNRNAVYKYKSAKTNVGWVEKEINVFMDFQDTTDIQIEY